METSPGARRVPPLDISAKLEESLQRHCAGTNRTQTGVRRTIRTTRIGRSIDTPRFHACSPSGTRPSDTYRASGGRRLGTRDESQFQVSARRTTHCLSWTALECSWKPTCTPHAEMPVHGQELRRYRASLLQRVQRAGPTARLRLACEHDSTHSGNRFCGHSGLCSKWRQPRDVLCWLGVVETARIPERVCGLRSSSAKSADECMSKSLRCRGGWRAARRGRWAARAVRAACGKRGFHLRGRGDGTEAGFVCHLHLTGWPHVWPAALAAAPRTAPVPGSIRPYVRWTLDYPSCTLRDHREDAGRYCPRGVCIYISAACMPSLLSIARRSIG